jgi:anhydro-N-acetylmuramic acid kinase
MMVIGLMSGTSADGVDAALVRFRGRAERPDWQLIGQASVPYPSELRDRIVAVAQGVPHPAGELLELAEAITACQAEAALACDPQRRASLIGCHGQTIWHRPPSATTDGGTTAGASWQMLLAPALAQRLERPVVHDFRAADLACGGQGAPLVPMADAALLGRIDGWRALLNLGGIANLTLIPPRCGPDRDAPVLGWDCGPANSLIDLAVEHFSAGSEYFDADGRRASAGRVEETAIQRWLQEPYFLQAAPKSTGRELFGRADLQRRLEELTHLQPDDCIATLTAFTAAVVAADLERSPSQGRPRPLELVVAGGGGRNPVLMEGLRQRCRGIRVERSDRLALPVDSREAVVFALLAWWHWRRHPGNAPAVTGAHRRVLLGQRAEPV